MAVEARGSRFSRTNNLITAAVMILLGAWFTYDGWFSADFQQKNTVDGKPNIDLKINRYVPALLFPLGLYFVYQAQRMSKRKITADEKGLTLENGNQIAYEQFTQIDNRFFAKEGHFTMEYKDGGETRKLKFSDRQYDGLGLLLDEIVKKTGAAPPEEK